jgi:competence protein ComEC
LKRSQLLSEAPFIRVALPFIAGIIFNFLMPVNQSFICYLLIAVFVAGLFFAFYPVLSSKYNMRWVTGALLQLSVFLLGVYITASKSEMLDSSSLSDTHTKTYVAVLEESAETNGRWVRCFVRVKEEILSQKWNSQNEKLLLYLTQSTNSKNLKAGDVIAFEGRLSQIAFSGNPYEFNYRNYLSKQGIHWAAYIDTSHWKLLDHQQLSFIWQLTHNLRDRLLGLFSHLGMKEDELGVAMALTIGDKANLDTEIKQAYTASGTMHLLAVSGMHVALIYWVMGLLIRFPSRRLSIATVQALFLIMMLWFYAFITGMPASILRASVMCTFIIVSELFNRQSSVYNSLAVTCFLLLLYNPYYLTDAGFQLSFLAVLSIVIFYQPIFQLYETKNWLMHQIWSVTAVTIAAQILTTPVSLYYFHQFPLLFIVTNLVMIPLSTGIIYFAIFLVSMSWWSAGVLWLGKVFNGMIWLLNQFVLLVEKIPHSTIQGFYISGVEVGLIYIAILFLALYLFIKKRIALVAFLAVVLVGLCIQIVSTYRDLHRHEVVIYNEKGNTVLQFLSGNESVWMVSKRTCKIDKFIKTASEAMGSQTNSVFYIDSLQTSTRSGGCFINKDLWAMGNFVRFRNRSFLIKNTNELSSNDILADYQIIRYQRMSKSKKVYELVNSNLILDSSVPFYAYSRLKEIFPKANICWIQEGAKVICAE